MARWLAALLLLLSAGVVSAEPVTDGFETETLGPLWNTRFATPGRVSMPRELVHSGTGALRVEIHEGDVSMVGSDGFEYAFRMYVPADFPVVDTRLARHRAVAPALPRLPEA